MAYSSDVNKLLAEGAKLYATKEYEAAASKYADACGAYNEEHHEDDADLLFLYGKALFQAAVLKLEVFGGRPDKEEAEREKEEEEGGAFQFQEDAPLAEEDDRVENEEKEEQKEEENEEGQAQNEEEQEEESDFEVAWEILDSTRALVEDKIAALRHEKVEEPAVPYLQSDSDEPASDFVAYTKKLSEVYDLLGEVSLESENFSQSAEDLQRSLELRSQLYPEHLSLISESHYKLSLALEFCVEDPESRTKAAEHMKKAIDSIKARNADEKDAKKKKDNADLIKDLQVRYQELSRDPVDELKLQQVDIIKGILGEVAAPAATPVAVNDLTSVVKKRKLKPAGPGEKRKKT